MASYPTVSLQPGSTNTSAVKQLQDFLVSQGYMTKAQVSTGYGIYGPQTTAAVLAYQKAKGIDYSSGPGYWGPKTIAASSTSQPKTTTSTTTQPKTTSTSTNTSTSTSHPRTTTTSTQTTSGYRPLDKTVLSSVTSNLGPGMQNDPNQVRALQQALVNAGYMTQAQMNTGPGIYGPQTTAAVALWQRTNGIPTSGNDGFFGPVSRNFIQTGQQPDPNAPIINPNLPRGDNTAITDPYNLPPGILPDGAANSGIMNLPDEALRNTIPQLKPGTPEYEKAMKKINTAYFDVLQQQMNARTQQEQQMAQYNWSVLKKNIETNLNVKLSDDAFQAWDQVQGLQNQFGGQNISNSGLQNEAIDDYLKKIRQSGAISRTAAQSDQEKYQMDYYTKFATPEQIQAFAAANPSLAQQWGLIPSDDIRNAMSMSTLRAKYPNLSDEDLQAYRASILDENGNYRSNLYQNYMTGSSPMTAPGSEQRQYDPVTGKVISYTVTPGDYGVTDIAAAKKQFQEGTLQNQNDAAVADYNYQLNGGGLSVKSSNPTTDTVSGTSGGTRFNSIEPSSSTSTKTASTKTTTPTTTKTTTTSKTSEPVRVLRAYTTTSGERVTKYSDGTEKRVKV